MPFGQPALVSNAESCGIVCERWSAREPHAQFEALGTHIVRVPPRHHVVIDDVPYSFRLKSLFERCLDKLLAPGSDTLAVEINSHAHLSGGADYQDGEHGAADILTSLRGRSPAPPPARPPRRQIHTLQWSRICWAARLSNCWAGAKPVPFFRVPFEEGV